MIQGFFRIIGLLVISFFITACAQGDDVSILKHSCTGCHNLIPVCSKLGQKGPKDWKITIESMKKVGAKVSTADVERLAEFLSRQNRLTADFCNLN